MTDQCLSKFYWPARSSARLLAALFSVILLLSACASNDEIEESDDPLPLQDFQAKVKLDRQWSRSIGDGQGKHYDRLSIGFSARGSDDSAGDVYVASVDGIVARYNSAGKRLWRVKLREMLSAGVGVGADLALLATANGEVVALAAADGTERWRIDARGEVLASPQAAGDQVIVQTYDGRVLGLRSSDGEERWVFSSDVPLLTLRGTATPLLEDGLVYVGLANGKIVVLDQESGVLRWSRALTIAKGQSEIERIVDVDATPLVTNSGVYAAAFQGYVYALDPRSGQPRWRFEASSYRELAEGFGNIYVVDEKSRLYALDASSGELRWEQSELLRRELSAPVVFDGFLLVADYKGYIHVLSQVDGRVVGRARVDGSGVRVPMRVVAGQLLVYANDGKIAAYSMETLAQ